MNKPEVIRHNAKLILAQVRGKSKKERREFYAILSAGPFGLMLRAVEIIMQASKPVTINVDTGFDAEYDRITTSINRGARRADFRG